MLAPLKFPVPFPRHIGLQDSEPVVNLVLCTGGLLSSSIVFAEFVAVEGDMQPGEEPGSAMDVE
jgi:hypothetical protein